MSEPRLLSRYVETGALAALFNDKRFVELVRKDQYLTQAMVSALKRAADFNLARQFIREIAPIRLVEPPTELLIPTHMHALVLNNVHGFTTYRRACR